MMTAEVSAFLEAFCSWARVQTDIAAVLLVGSYARGSASVSSDVDLVILTSNVNKYLRDQSWFSLFGKVAESREEDYGRLTSMRVFYRNGLEVEYGFTTSAWAKVPIDDGTLRVIRDGMEVLHDPDGIIVRMGREIQPR